MAKEELPRFVQMISKRVGVKPKPFQIERNPELIPDYFQVLPEDMEPGCFIVKDIAPGLSVVGLRQKPGLLPNCRLEGFEDKFYGDLLFFRDSAGIVIDVTPDDLLIVISIIRPLTRSEAQIAPLSDS